MSLLKKIASLALAFLFVFGLSSCGTYHFANNPNGSNSTGQASGSTDSSVNVGDYANPSTVALYHFVDGKRVPYTEASGIDAIWSGENSVKTSAFNANGVAIVDGLDGDYKVTLSSLPNGYTYNPNVHTTTNLTRDIDIELYEIIIPQGDGSGEYHNYVQLDDDTKNALNPYVYRVQVDDEADRVHCQFSPPKSGMYSVESWVDVTAQNINPRLDVYIGSFAYKRFDYELEDGGVSKGYTTNFKHEVKITTAEIGNDFSFAIHAGEKNNNYPVTVDFVVQCDGEWVVERPQAKMMTHGALKEQKNYATTRTNSEYQLVWASVDVTTGTDTRLFDAEKFKFNEDTGYYHVYDETLFDGYTETYYKLVEVSKDKYEYQVDSTQTFADGYGPILYMKITANLSPFVDDVSFSTVEYQGNNSLTVSQGTENYKMFIEGFAQLEAINHVCCWTMSDEEKANYRQYTGYMNSCNHDGLYGVTEELKAFAQKYSVNQELFADGEGRAESFGYDALDADQWLFACAYYRKIS